MDIENLRSWISRPDVCRCCLSASGAWDVTASYISDSGAKEIYCDMLRDCYGITLSHVTPWGPSRMVCSLCLGQLRDACSFRNQVLRSEQHFVEYCSNKEKHNLREEDKELHSPEDDSFVGDHLIPSDAENDKTVLQRKHDDEVIKENEKNTNKRKRHKTGKVKQKKKKIDPNKDYDSDEPIAFLLKKNERLDDEGFKGDENIEAVKLNADAVVEDLPQTGAVIGSKYVSERKRGIVTCHTVLRETTACPFRHHKSWFQCFFCSEDFMEINQLRDHTTQTHSDLELELKKMKRYPRSLQIEISNLECRNCRLNLTDVSEMRRHLGEIHNKVIYSECIADFKLNVSPYTCHICKQEFHVFRTLTTHLNEHYANCICDVCGKSFLNSKRLKVHKRTHESGAYPCTECGKVLKTKISRSNHMENAHSKRQIKCQICFEPMKHYNDRIKHMSEVHNITHKFQCPICGREYNIKHYLATHIRQTHGHKNKKCSECGMAFITNHGLKKHMLRHSGEKPYSCSVCGKSYARSYTLKEHMRAHENERRFVCPE